MTIKPEYDFLGGEVLLIDKPLEWTSFDAVNKIRATLKRALGVKKIKVGHAGTLDPKADGLLIVCTGKFTKRIEEFQGLEKEYTGTFTLGATTPSFDTETEPDKTFPTEHLTEQQIVSTAKSFVGEMDQTPPIFSAKKVDGKPAYIAARKGEEVNVRTFRITIHEFEITGIELPLVHFRIVCSKGTYIRSIANDFGKALSSGAFLSALRRTKIGEFTVEDGTTIDAWVNHVNSLNLTAPA